MKIWTKTIFPPSLPLSELATKDRYGALIQFAQYGNHRSEYGWEVAYIVPPSQGGRATLDNLEPLFWRNKEAGRGRMSGLFDEPEEFFTWNGYKNAWKYASRVPQS